MRSAGNRALALVEPRATTPVSFAPHGGFAIPYATANGLTRQLEAMGEIPTLFAIVNRTSSACGQVEWKLWKKAASGLKEDRTEVTNHAAYDLWQQPNPFMTQGEYVEACQQHVDLAGEAWWVANRIAGIPISLWPVRPDRMAPVPDDRKFLSHHEYRDPWGRTIELKLDDVVQLRMPDPMNPYRGLSPVRALMTDLESAKFATEWNRNFFLNSAQPGGIIELDEMVQDEDFQRLRRHWDEQHRGVANAHRVALLEAGKWVNRTFTMREMQFVELMGVSDDRLLRGFAFPKSMLGIAEDVNRANAEAAEYVFAKYLTVPRLNRFRQALNTRLLRMYGRETVAAYEFDFENPVPIDRVAEAAERKAKVEAFKILVDAGVQRESAAKVCDLPEMVYEEKPEPVVPMIAPSVDELQKQAEATARLILARLEQRELPALERPREVIECPRDHVHHRPRNADDPPDDPEAVDAVDLTGLQAEYVAALGLALDAYLTGTLIAWVNDLVEQVRNLVLAGTLELLSNLGLDTTEFAAALGEAMADLGAKAADHMVGEAAAQDVVVEAEAPSRSDIDSRARATANIMADVLRTSASREAVRLAGPDADADTVADGVLAKLDALTDASARLELGSALTASQQMGRAATIKTAPSGAIYASEVMDAATCKYCREIHGRWIGSTDDLAPIWKLYPGTGYINCEGRERCLGTFVGVWRDDVDNHVRKQTKKEAAGA